MTSCTAGRGSHRPHQERGDRRRDHKKAEQQYSSVWRPFQGRFGALFGFLALVFRPIVQAPAPAIRQRSYQPPESMCNTHKHFPSTYARIGVVPERMRLLSPHGYLSNKSGPEHKSSFSSCIEKFCPFIIQQHRYFHRMSSHQTTSQFMLRSSRYL